MGFGNAALLAGMLLGLVPIIIHLINKRRARLVRFSAIEFLLLSDRKLARRLKLKQILVLALRVLLLVAMAFALAKPYLEPEATGGINVSEPGAVALIIDDSASLNAVEPDGRTRFERIVEEAGRLVGSRGPRTSVAIIASGAPARVLTPGLSFDDKALTAALGRLSPGDRAQDFDGALREAGRLLSESGEARRQVLVVSDQARHMWEQAPDAWTWAPLSEVAPIFPGENIAPPNVAIAGVRVNDDETGRGFVIEADVQNHGPEALTLPVSLEVGSTRATETVTIGPGAKETVMFRGAEKPDRTHGRATIEAGPANALPNDDTWYFTATERTALRVLLVNGAPRNPGWLDELYFLRPALSLTPPGHPPIGITTIAPSDITPGGLQVVDVVVLANVGTLTKEQVLALTQFVERGGGLLMTAGDKLDPRTANESFGPLLPFRIREVKTIGRTDDPQSVLQALNLATVDFDHPVFAVFRGLQDSSLFKARVTSWALIDTEGAKDAKVLASLTGGVPALVEAPLGRGRVMLWTSSLDRDWTDLVLRTSFPPLMQRMAAWLGRLLDARGGDEPASLGLVVGRSTRLPVPDGLGPVTVRRPDGTELSVEAPEGANPNEGGEASIFIETIDMAGHWEVMRTGEPERAKVVAANTDRRESDLGLADAGMIAAATDVLTRDNGVLPAFGPEDGDLTSADVDGSESSRTVLWPWILAGLFLLFGGEAWLLIRS
jgi:hypothetical protein